jgi:drug/metabolite transporter (DMT)-like permease
MNPMNPTRPLPGNRYLLIVAMLLADSVHYVFARLLLPLVPPGSSALFVLAIATVEVALYGLARKQLNLRAFREHKWSLLAIGFLVATATNLSFQAVRFIDPGTASMLSQTTVLFALGFSLLWLRERFTLAQAAGAVLALAGALLITFQRGDYLRVGALIVISSSFLYALHAAVSKRYIGDMDFLDFFFFRLLCSTAFLFPLAWSTGDLVWPASRAWPLLLLVGTVDVAVSRALYYVVLQRLKLSVHAIALTASPLLAVIWAMLLFDAHPTLRQLLGGVAVILGTLVVVSQRTRN